MKKLRFVLLAILATSFVAHAREISIRDIRDEDGIIYYRNESRPFTGKIKDSKDRNYYENGRPHGKWVTFHPNGAMKSIENWQNGHLEGKYVIYQADGKKIMETRYKNGKEDGPYTLYHPNGRIHVRGNLKNGEPVGKFEFYNDKGELVATN